MERVYVDFASSDNPPIMQQPSTQIVLLSNTNKAYEISFDKKFTKLTVLVEFKGKPTGWSLHIADEKSSDGHGGASGSLPAMENCAELQILDETMTIWSKALGAGIVDPLVKKELSLTDGSMKFVIQNQFISWGHGYEILQTPNSKLIFNNQSNDRKIYVGFNRVVAGAGATNRTGTGIIRAIITLE